MMLPPGYGRLNPLEESENAQETATTKETRIVLASENWNIKMRLIGETRAPDLNHEYHLCIENKKSNLYNHIAFE